MPKYSTHLIFNLTILSAMVVIYQYNPVLTPTQLAFFLGAFVIGTCIATPDLDTKSEASRRCGIVCAPYRKLAKHRGTSHHWLWGTAARIVYFTLIIIIALWVLGWLASPREYIPALGDYKYELLAGAAGLFISNILHIFLDNVV